MQSLTPITLLGLVVAACCSAPGQPATVASYALVVEDAASPSDPARRARFVEQFNAGMDAFGHPLGPPGTPGASRIEVRITRWGAAASGPPPSCQGLNVALCAAQQQKFLDQAQRCDLQARVARPGAGVQPFAVATATDANGQACGYRAAYEVDRILRGEPAPH